MRKTLKIFVSAGEASGDEHAARFVKGLELDGAELFGMGARKLEAIGTRLVVDAEKEASVMGFSDVLMSLPKIIRALNKLKLCLKTERPDLVLLVDYPDFNLRLARYAKSLGLKVVYLIPPTAWAWRESRTKLLEPLDLVLCIYPFEETFFRERGVNAHYIGHPFLTELEAFKQMESFERRDFLSSLNLKPDSKILAVFPGSRGGELKLHSALLVESLKLLKSKIPDLQFLVSNAVGINPEYLKSTFSGIHDLVVSRINTNLDVLRASDAGLLKSGTTNLQAALAMLPFVMFYKISLSTELFARAMFPGRTFSIVNLIRPNSVPELLQRDATPESITSEIIPLLNDNEARNRQFSNFNEVRNILAREGNSPVELIHRLMEV